MAINIKEILTTDSDLIKVDKTNYNFDQIIANGGGPTGSKGQKGEIGGVGTTGQKGEKGDTGAKGDVGPVGPDVNNWGRVDHNTNTGTSILKPKKDNDDTEPASIFLGDTTYSDGVTDGVVNTSAWLNIALPNLSSYYSNFASLLTGTTSVLNFSSSTLNGVDTYTITHGISTNDVNLLISLKNAIEISATDLVDINSNTVVKIRAGQNNVVVGPDSPSISSGQFDVRYADTFVRGDLTIGTSTGGYVKVPVGTTAQRPTGALGMVRFNSDLDVGYSNDLGSLEAYVPHQDGAYWRPLGILADADGDTFISPDYNLNDGTENVITISVGEPSGGSYIQDFVGTIGETVQDGSTGLDRVFRYNNVIYAADDILVDNGHGLRIRQNTTTPGSSQVNAANSGAAADKRTLVDYFYRESTLQYDVITLASQPITGMNLNLAGVKYSNDVLIGHAFSDLSGSFSSVSVGIIISNTTKMSYVKMGHMVTVWGRIDMVTQPVDYDKLQSGDVNLSGIGTTNNPIPKNFRRAGFKIGGVDHFPYTSALTTERVIFPIAINPNDATGVVLAGVTKRYFGVIFPGMNVFNILEVDDQDGRLPTTDTESIGYEGRYLNISDLITSTNTTSPLYSLITIDYNFSMPVNQNSYDLGADSYTTYIEDDGSLVPVLPGGQVSTSGSGISPA